MTLSQNEACNCEKSVKDRIIAVAEELFAEKGFDATTVRDIATAADCNLASVNYYFGGKMNLYEAIWMHHLRLMRNARIDSIEAVMSHTDEPDALEQLLRSFAESFLGPWVDDRRTRSLMKLMAREMVDPKLAPELFAGNVINPTIQAMRKALLIVCPRLDEKQVPLIVFSIAGQLVHMIRLNSIFDRAHSSDLADFDTAAAIEHIVRFSAGGIRACIGEKNQ